MIDGYNITVFAKEMTNMLKTFFPVLTVLR